MRNAAKKRSSKETESLYAHIIANLSTIEKEAEKAEEEKKAERAAVRTRRIAFVEAKKARKEAEEEEIRKTIASWGLDLSKLERRTK